MKPFGLKLCLSHSFLDDSLESDLKIIKIFYQKRDFMVFGILGSEISRGFLDIIYEYSPLTRFGNDAVTPDQPPLVAFMSK